MGAFGDDVTPHPSDLELATYLDGRLEPAIRERIESHLAECPACRDDVVATRTLRPRARFTSLRGSGALAAAAAVLVLAVLLVRNDGARTVREPVTRSAGAASARVITFAPAAVENSREVRFVWATVPGALSYRLTITSADGAPAWTRSGTDTSATMPDSVATPGRRLVWSVDALLSDGTERSSGLRNLQLVP